MIKITIQVLLLLFLVGCATPVQRPPAPSTTVTMGVIGAGGGAAVGSLVSGLGAPMGAVFGGMIGSIIGNKLEKNRTLVRELQDYGVLFFEVGEQIRVVIPADKLFFPRSPLRRSDFNPIVKKVIVLLDRYEKIAVKVAAYTDNQGSVDRNRALSQAWAESVKKYLWQHGLDVRLLYAIGYGSEYSVATNSTSEGREANRRVEITMEQVSA